MSYLAQGLMSGFNQGFSAGNARKEKTREMEQRDKDILARALFEKEMLEKNIAADAKNNEARIAADDKRAMNDFENRQIERGADRLDADLRRQIGASEQAPRNRLLSAQAKAIEMENSRAMTSAGAQPQPTAKVRKTFGPGNDSYYEYNAPLSDIERTAASAPSTAFKSPFASQISRLGKTIAEEQAAIDTGDNRSGFLGLGKRRETVRKAQAEMQRLKALELEEMVRTGAITPDEADRRADMLLN